VLNKRKRLYYCVAIVGLRMHVRKNVSLHRPKQALYSSV